jgi:hypothetical protein
MRFKRTIRLYAPAWLLSPLVRLYRTWRRTSVARPEQSYLRDKFCERPFREFEIANNADVFLCCPNYLPHSVGSAKNASAEQLLNSERAIEIRRSIISGAFTFCDAERCPAIRAKRLPKRSEVTDPEMLAHIAADTGIVKAARYVRLSYDSTCNLYCPSCRSRKIVLKGAAFDEAMRITNDVALPVMRTAEMVMMNGYGDVFSSRICRHLLRAVNPADYPNLKLFFLTNGVLFTEQEWNKFPNIHGMVHSISVSIDASAKEVYDKVRLGGDFEKLCRNLEFIARLRRGGVIEDFEITMVVQRENFRQMRDFWEWGKRLGCDQVTFQRLADWNSLSRPEYEARAVHLPKNPLKTEYDAAVSELFAAAIGGPRIYGDLLKVA